MKALEPESVRPDAQAEEEDEPPQSPLVWGVRRVLYQVDALAGDTSFQTLVRARLRAGCLPAAPGGRR